VLLARELATGMDTGVALLYWHKRACFLVQTYLLRERAAGMDTGVPYPQDVAGGIGVAGMELAVLAQRVNALASQDPKVLLTSIASAGSGVLISFAEIVLFARVFLVALLNEVRAFSCFTGTKVLGLLGQSTASRASSSWRAAPQRGACFTCFPGTEGQILTQKRTNTAAQRGTCRAVRAACSRAKIYYCTCVTGTKVQTLTQILQRNEILAVKIRAACSRAEAGKTVVAVLGMAHVNGVATILDLPQRKEE
jgi:hypothetical protein